MRFTRCFTADQYARGLASWSWAGVDGKVAMFTSYFGDVFFEAEDGWWFLDTIEGTLTRPWDSRIAMEFTLDSPDGRHRYLLGEMVVAAQQRGVVMGDREVYMFIPPPIVCGRLDADSIQSLDFVVALNIAGQIHHQIRTMGLTMGRTPPATPVGGRVISPPGTVYCVWHRWEDVWRWTRSMRRARESGFVTRSSTMRARAGRPAPRCAGCRSSC